MLICDWNIAETCQQKTSIYNSEGNSWNMNMQQIRIQCGDDRQTDHATILGLWMTQFFKDNFRAAWSDSNDCRIFQFSKMIQLSKKLPVLLLVLRGYMQRQGRHTAVIAILETRIQVSQMPKTHTRCPGRRRPRGSENKSKSGAA